MRSVKWLKSPQTEEFVGDYWEVLCEHGQALKICQRDWEGEILRQAYVKQQECKEVPVFSVEGKEK